ncbi:DNA-binding protein [Photobacterium carnosum]|uniref:DNA-binding protein n=1 Tax=Photobacterium carnosum TaxID=2023717 RepID=A0A2N4UME9_9GAMM|nr:PAS domain-containing protein [Photobacterium carnosum]MCD9548052.1 DNA-binding protein [Photobacterium carnosum]MCF2305301.1 DNA-binding protein [Photobacterium carnosum]PLC56211.1 DNA-binding protein [Photobacterium carnosum]
MIGVLHKIFTEDDRVILRSQIPFIDCLGAMFGDNCEIVLHSFENLHSSVIHIINGHITDRKIGAPVTNIALEKLSEFKKTNEKWDVYFSNASKDNKAFKSSSTLITNKDNIPIGMICMNYSLDVSLHSLMKNFFEPVNRKNESFSQDVNNLITSHLEPIRNNVYTNSEISSKNKVQEIIKQLNDIDLFELPITNKIVSHELGISSATIYKHLRSLKKNKEKEPGVVKPI